MSQFTIGTMALQLTGGAGIGSMGIGGGAGVGAIAGAVAAVTKSIIDAVTAAIRRIVNFIRDQIRKVFAERARLAQFDPTMAAAEMTAVIGKLVRDIGRARVLGPAMLELTQVVERIKNGIEPLIQLVQEKLIGALTALANAVAAIVDQLGTVMVMVQTFINLLSLQITRLIDMMPSDALLPGRPGAMLGGVRDLLEAIFNAVGGVRKALNEADDSDKFKHINDIAMNDLRVLTEGGALHGLGGRIPIGPGGRDLFSAP